MLHGFLVYLIITSNNYVLNILNNIYPSKDSHIFKFASKIQLFSQWNRILHRDIHLPFSKNVKFLHQSWCHK